MSEGQSNGVREGVRWGGRETGQGGRGERERRRERGAVDI